MESISKLVTKPLRTLWFTPQSSFFINDPPDYSDAPFWPVICLSASQAVESGCQARPGGYLYVQGSGDDQEAWSHVRRIVNIHWLSRDYICIYKHFPFLVTNSYIYRD